MEREEEEKDGERELGREREREGRSGLVVVAGRLDLRLWLLPLGWIAEHLVPTTYAMHLPVPYNPLPPTPKQLSRRGAQRGCKYGEQQLRWWERCMGARICDAINSTSVNPLLNPLAASQEVLSPIREKRMWPVGAQTLNCAHSHLRLALPRSTPRVRRPGPWKSPRREAPVLQGNPTSAPPSLPAGGKGVVGKSDIFCVLEISDANSAIFANHLLGEASGCCGGCTKRQVWGMTRDPASF